MPVATSVNTSRVKRTMRKMVAAWLADPMLLAEAQ